MPQQQDGQEVQESGKTSNYSAKLASRLKFELCPHEMKWRSQLNCVKCVEEVIREAIDKTLEEAEQATCAFCRSGAELVGQQHKLRTSENNMTSYSYTYIDCYAAAIRSLKQSNSGRAEHEAGERR